MKKTQTKSSIVQARTDGVNVIQSHVQEVIKPSGTYAPRKQYNIVKAILCVCLFLCGCDQDRNRNSVHSLHPKKGGRLQNKVYSQPRARMQNARLCDILPMEARGRVITIYLSTAMIISVIIEHIPKRAPQNAYISQPTERKKRKKVIVNYCILIYTSNAKTLPPPSALSTLSITFIFCHYGNVTSIRQAMSN